MNSESRCLLLVDDDVLVRDAVAAMLQDEGFEVVEAADAAEAIELFRGGLQVAAMMTDVDLGAGPSGVELADTLRELQPDLRVIFITGRLTSLSGRVFGDREAVLPKPFASDALSRVVKRMTSPE